jgi:hypothetical protein
MFLDLFIKNVILVSSVIFYSHFSAYECLARRGEGRFGHNIKRRLLFFEEDRGTPMPPRVSTVATGRGEVAGSGRGCKFQEVLSCTTRRVLIRSSYSGGLFGFSKGVFTFGTKSEKILVLCESRLIL